MNYQKRLYSDKGDANTVSQILWLALSVVLIIGVSKVISSAVAIKNNEVQKTINTSNTTKMSTFNKNDDTSSPKYTGPKFDHTYGSQNGSSHSQSNRYNHSGRRWGGNRYTGPSFDSR